jgi:hypothetical protein
LLLLFGLSSLFFFACLLVLLFYFLDAPTSFLANDFFFRTASGITSGDILQNSAPRLLMTLTERETQWNNKSMLYSNRHPS